MLLRYNRARIIALLAAALLLSGCRGGTESLGSSVPDSSSLVGSVEVTVSGESGNTSAAVTAEPEESDTPGGEPTIDTDDGSESAETSESAEPPAPETESAPADTSAVSSALQTTEMSIPAEPDPPLASTPPATTAATTTTAPKPPAEVIIPEVKKVSSPGEKTFTAGGSVIDYSNASLGYISLKYGGSSDKVRLQIICGTTYDYMLPADGTVRYFPLSCGSGKYTVRLWEHDHDNFYSNPIDETISVTVSDEVAMFLYPNYYVDFGQQSNAVKKSAEVCAGASGTIEKIAAIFKYITDNVTYDKQLAAAVQSGYVPDPDATLRSLKGICFDYSALFASMTRAQGIPTRLVIGYASPDIYHAWNEVYTTETGWVTPELFLKQSGYNLLDSTFYAGASDKADIADYMSTKSNYTALYYY